MIRGRVGAEEAVGMLVEHTGMPVASAEAEVRRYSSNPGYQLCYLLGKVKLDSYRQELQGLWAGNYSDRRFHDLVLGAGCIPIEMMRRFEREEREDQSRSEGP